MPNCPKCNAPYMPGDTECRKCGIVFSKVKGSGASCKSLDKRPGDVVKRVAADAPKENGLTPQRSRVVLTVVIVIGCVIVLFVLRAIGERRSNPASIFLFTNETPSVTVDEKVVTPYGTSRQPKDTILYRVFPREYGSTVKVDSPGGSFSFSVKKNGCYFALCSKRWVKAYTIEYMPTEYKSPQQALTPSGKFLRFSYFMDGYGTSRMITKPEAKIIAGISHGTNFKYFTRPGPMNLEGMDVAEHRVFLPEEKIPATLTVSLGDHAQRTAFAWVGPKERELLK